MNLRKEWSVNSSNEVLDRFYSRGETVNEVVENFDIRRRYSTEGEQLTINGQTDWCLVQTSSNPLRELDDLRKIHCPMSMRLNRGDYVNYENDTWLIDTNVVNVENAYQSARMSRCSYILKWQDVSGNIVEKPVVTYNASSYNNGVEEGKNVEIGSDQLMILLPFDDDTKIVKRGKKFFIDNNMDDPMVYRLTRPDRTTYVFNGIGYIQWLVTECQYTANEEDLKYGVCDYTPPTPAPLTEGDETIILSSNITGVISGNKNLKIGLSRTYTASLVDENGSAVEWSDDFIWNVVSDFDVFSSVADNKITLSVEDEMFVGSSFVLQILHKNDDVPVSSIEISVVGLA